jgi:NADH dehydrogenase [ubiquinone] 1 alpha subcomplex assembly factor 1
MVPSFRGRTLDMANFPGDSLEEIGFLIGNKKAEDFKLLIDYISVQ